LVLRIISNGNIWVGILLLLAFLACHLLLYSKADFSYATPTTSANYILVLLLGLFILGEKVTLARWAGVALITFGVLLVCGTKPRMREAT